MHPRLVVLVLVTAVAASTDLASGVTFAVNGSLDASRDYKTCPR